MTTFDSQPVAEASGAELKRQIREAVERIGKLQAERHALEEVRDDLLSEEQSLMEMLQAAQAERAELERRLEAERQRVADTEKEIAAMREEALVLNHRFLENESRTRELASKNAAAEEELNSLRGGLAAAGGALRVAQDDVVRINRKLGQRG